MKKYLVKRILSFITLYNKQKFITNSWGIILNPFYILRSRLYQNIFLNKDFIHGKVLDYGCGNSPYKDIFVYDDYFRADVIQNEEEVSPIIDAKTIYNSKYFDSILCTEVLEHVTKVDDTICEMYRVLKPGGYAIITTPFVWPIHAHPYDYRRFNIDGLTTLLGEKFQIVNTFRSSNYVETIFQLIIAKIYLKISPKNMWLQIITAIFIAPITILGLILGKLSKDKTLYLSNIIIIKKNEEN